MLTSCFVVVAGFSVVGSVGFFVVGGVGFCVVGCAVVGAFVVAGGLVVLGVRVEDSAFVVGGVRVVDGAFVVVGVFVVGCVLVVVSSCGGASVGSSIWISVVGFGFLRFVVSVTLVSGISSGAFRQAAKSTARERQSTDTRMRLVMRFVGFIL